MKRGWFTCGRSNNDRMIQCAFFQQSGIVIECTVTIVAEGIKITISIPGQFIDWGNVDICLLPG